MRDKHCETTAARSFGRIEIVLPGVQHRGQRAQADIELIGLRAKVAIIFEVNPMFLVNVSRVGSNRPAPVPDLDLHFLAS